MSWHFSQALVEEYSAANSLDGELSALLKSMYFVPSDLCNDKTKGTYYHSQFGMMFVPLTEDRGTDLLTWFLEDSPVSRSVQQRTATQQQQISGPKCSESSEKLNQNLSLLRTSLPKLSPKPPQIAEASDTKQKQSAYPRKTWVQTTFGSDIGYLHTPTCAMNYAATSMQKHPNCRIFVQVFGKPTPTNQEWLMGWPIGWTDSTPLEMDKFQSWQRQHGLSC